MDNYCLHNGSLPCRQLLRQLMLLDDKVENTRSKKMLSSYEAGSAPLHSQEKKERRTSNAVDHVCVLQSSAFAPGPSVPPSQPTLSLCTLKWAPDAKLFYT